MIQYTNLKAYAHPSGYSGFQNVTHVFVLASTGEEYTNCGGVYTSDITLVAEGLAYKTWLNEFMPRQSTSLKDTGLSFSYNGVCHTYAMREVLLCINDKNVSLAAGDDLCVAYYGKYGTGLKYLEKRLRDSFFEAQKKDNLPPEILDKVISRIYNTLEEEVEAWVSVLRNYVDIDVLTYFKSSNDWQFLRQRIGQVVKKREELFEACFDWNSKTLSDEYAFKLKKLYLDEFKEYVVFLSECGYFSREEADKFYEKFERVLTEHRKYYMAIAQSESSNGTDI